MLALPKRYLLSGLIFAGFFIMSGLRVNLNVAIGAMVNSHTVNINGTDVTQPGEFDWDSKMQGIVLGSFYWGYMVFQIPGGLLAMRVGGARLFGFGIGIASVLTLLTPFAARCSPIGLIIMRVGEGLALGVLFPCNHAIWSHWAPPAERTTLVTVSVAGTSVGYLMTMPITGLLTKYGFDGGWGSVFYCFGVFGLLWYMVWLLCVHETPEQHPSMSAEERELLSHNDKDLTKVGKVNVPWMSILTSLPVWAIAAANFALDWAFYVLLISIPKFLVEVLDTEIHKMGFMAAAPFLIKGICTPVAGLSADVLRKYAWSTKTVRRCFYAVGTLSTGVFILIVGYTSSVAAVVVCMAISGATTSLSYPAYTVNMLDIAPRCAGVIMGLCNTLGATAGFLSPMLVGFVTPNQTVDEWRAVFWINAILMCIGTGLFCSLLEGDRQVWDIVEDSNDDKVDLSKNIEEFEPKD